MITKNITYWFVILLVLCGTIFALFSIPPEEHVVRSDDRLFKARVFTSEEIDVTVSTIVKEGESIFDSSIYEVSPSLSSLIRPAVLTYQYNPESERIQNPLDLQFIFLDKEKGLWRFVDTQIDTKHHLLRAETTHLSQWAIFETQTFNIDPLLIKHAVNELLKRVPLGVVGFTMEYVVDINEDVSIALGELTTGGCQGVFSSGIEKRFDTEYFQDQLHVFVTWELAQGCEEGEQIMEVLRNE